MAFIKRLVFVTLVAALAQAYASPSPHMRRLLNPSVTLDNGLTIQGGASSSTPNVVQFLGIPYAKSPLGDLRFAPPEPYCPGGRKVINGTALPPSCMQFSTSNPSFAVWIPHFQIGSAGMSEDCLTASVWAPEYAMENGSLPVLIWIYGGAFVTGGVDVEWQNPAHWVQRTQGHIVVAINYRVNIFGFPNAAGLNQQNLGMLDQRLAVQWVQENIVKFGGDPSRMVLWGQSAGSISLDIYNFAWASDPIVKGFIMHSGTAHLVDGSALRNVDTTHSNFTFAAAKLGCANQTSAEAELACMRQVPATAIEDILHAYGDAGTTPALGFTPIADETVVFSNYTEKALRGEFSELPVIMGMVANEGVFLAPFSFTGVNQTLADFLSLEAFWCPTVKTTYERVSANRTTHRYFYTGNFTNISLRPWLGAYHGSELPLVFGTESNFNGNSTPFELSVSQAMQDSWLAFASDPVNGLSSSEWPAYEGPGGQVRVLAADGQVSQMLNVSTIEAECASLGFA